MEISGLYELPFALRCVVFPVAVLFACALLRVITNKLSRQAPPVFEGIPFIGGVLKFVKVTSRARSGRMTLANRLSMLISIKHAIAAKV